MYKYQGASRRIALGLASLLATGCGGSEASPKAAPQQTADNRRSTDLQHEDCALDSRERAVLDANGDGRPEIIRVFESGREVCRAVDINLDSVIDVFVYYDPSGQVRRRESGFDRDTRPDEVSVYVAGQLVRRERETNNDGKIDTWDYYEGGRLVREERDSNGDGYVDQWWTFHRPDRPDCGIVVSDDNGDGKPDAGSEIDLCAVEGAEGAAAKKIAAPASPAGAPGAPAATAAPTGTAPAPAPAPAPEAPAEQ
jgi:hypothetical protein